MSEELIEIRGLRKSFGRGDARLEVLKGIDLSVHRGEVMGVIGVSGAGKSTLVRCINRLEPWDEGTIRIGGEDMGALSEGALNRKRQKIGMIFQQFNLLNSCTVFDNIALPLRYLRKRPEEIRQRVQQLLEIVDLTQKAHAYEIEPCGSTVLCVDAMLAGIGSNSCGPELMEKYRTGTKVDFTWTFTPEKIC